jgi:hypothetical protein
VDTSDRLIGRRGDLFRVSYACLLSNLSANAECERRSIQNDWATNLWPRIAQSLRPQGQSLFMGDKSSNRWLIRGCCPLIETEVGFYVFSSSFKEQ